MPPLDIEKIDKEMVKVVNERKDRLRKITIQGAFPEEVVSNIMLGSRLTVCNIDFENNLITVVLTEPELER